MILVVIDKLYTNEEMIINETMKVSKYDKHRRK